MMRPPCWKASAAFSIAYAIESSAEWRARITMLSSSFISRTISLEVILSNPYDLGFRVSVPTRHLLCQPCRSVNGRRFDALHLECYVALPKLRLKTFDENRRSLPQTAGKTNSNLLFP